jgi:hypothetical protein
MVSDSSRSVPHGDGESVADEGVVRRELNRVKDFAQELSLDDLREGAWFAKLLRFSLDQYVHEVDADYFKAKYPFLPADAVVQARIQLAARYASIEGGLSAGAYTGAVAATLGTGGGASPLTLPAAGASFVLDLIFTSQVQFRLAYDISVLYRVPLDMKDPEDLWKLIRVAFAIKGGEAGRGAIGKGMPVLVRPIIKKVFSGSTLAAAKSLPVVGKYLLQRNIIKFAIPAVGVPLSMAVNYWSTRVVGGQAVKVFREEARIVEAARRMTERTVHHSELLWVLWLIIKSDALIHENERLLLKHVTALVADLDSELPALAGVQSTIDLDQKRVWSMLAAATGDLEGLYDAGVVAAAVDGKINVNELTNLRKLAEYCSVPYDEDAIRDAARRRT